MEIRHEVERQVHLRAQIGRRRASEQLAQRELFWHNVVREMLTSLSIMTLRRGGEPYDPEAEKAYKETFDGRLAVVTDLGVRVPIAEVHPVFACSVPGSEAERQLSNAVQCSVFQIRTPTGEVHTLPVHEIRSIHALSEQLMQQLEQAAMQAQEQPEGEESRPFGFAAFTSLARDSADEQDESEESPGGGEGMEHA